LCFRRLSLEHQGFPRPFKFCPQLEYSAPSRLNSSSSLTGRLFRPSNSLFSSSCSTRDRSRLLCFLQICLGFMQLLCPCADSSPLSLYPYHFSPPPFSLCVGVAFPFSSYSFVALIYLPQRESMFEIFFSPIGMRLEPLLFSAWPPFLPMSTSLCLPKQRRCLNPALSFTPIFFRQVYVGSTLTVLCPLADH